MPEEEKVYTSMYSRNAELYHHGILGMKWGLRNGPPYPLDSSVSTGSRLKKIFSRDKGGEEIKKKEEEKNQIANAKAIKKEQKKQVKELRRDTVTSKAIKQAKIMSDEELKQALNRLNMEKAYANVTKDITELSKQKPTLAQKAKAVIIKTGKEQASKLGNQLINNLTNQLANQINSTINAKIDEQKKENSKKDNQSGTSDGSKINDQKQKEPSKVSQAFKEGFNQYKEEYKQGWKDGMDWNQDPVTKEPKMNKKERAAAEETKRQADWYDAAAESYRQMYDNPNYEKYKDTIFRQYASAADKADKYREENKDIIDKYERQFGNKKRKK